MTPAPRRPARGGLRASRPEEATRRGVDPAELVAEAVVTYLAPRHTLGIIGLGASGRADVSEHVDEEVAAVLGR